MSHHDAPVRGGKLFQLDAEFATLLKGDIPADLEQGSALTHALERLLTPAREEQSVFQSSISDTPDVHEPTPQSLDFGSAIG